MTCSLCCLSGGPKDASVQDIPICSPVWGSSVFGFRKQLQSEWSRQSCKLVFWLEGRYEGCLSRGCVDLIRLVVNAIVPENFKSQPVVKVGLQRAEGSL